MDAFLAMIRWSEGTSRIPNSDNGYRVLVGSTPTHPILFDDYSKHPDVYNPRFNSTAAGAYQIIFPTWSGLCVQLGLNDFSPATQDAMASFLVAHECGALGAVQSGDFASAVALCAREWASLPGSTSGQPQSVMDNLVAAYTGAGGVLGT
jgi:muramidase (phage lysozyme)